MTKISYAGYRFPPEIIQQAIWLYLRFTLSFRDVEDLLAERGIVVSYETVRRWVNHFGPMIAADLRKRRPKPHWVWRLDEVYLKTGGRMVYFWRAVDAEGEVLDVLVQSKRNRRKLLKKYAFAPERLVTDNLRSYGSATRDLGLESRRERGRWKNNRAETSHQPTPRRERKMQRSSCVAACVGRWISRRGRRARDGRYRSSHHRPRAARGGVDVGGRGRRHLRRRLCKALCCRRCAAASGP
jgi:putative transposase